MSKIDDLIAAEAAAAENAPDTPDAPLPAHVRVTRGHNRSQVLQVRLNENEYRLIQKLADDNMLPVSTFARILLMQTVGS
jgi:hypothetical protein